MTTKTRTTNDKALEAFVASKAEIDRLLADLAALSDQHFNATPDEITWGHAGTANHIRERLQEIVSLASGAG